MDPSPLSIAVVMIALGVAPLLMARPASPSVSAIVVAAALCLAGIALLLRRRVGFWMALAAGLLTAATGAAGLARHPLGLPLPPAVSLVAGLYICARMAIVRLAVRRGSRSSADASDGESSDSPPP